MLLETLEHVALFMPFIDEALVCVPDKMVDQCTSSSSSVPLQVVSESEILSQNEASKLPLLDHQRRNYLLRTRLIKHQNVNAQFIMSDDDARPLKTVDVSRYFESNRYHRYYFYDLTQWQSNQTDFDAGQLSTGVILQYNNLPHLSYASHMPQIIDRDLFIEAAQDFTQYSSEHPICEWSSYFNFASFHYPEKFHEAKPFLTLCWPEHPLAWQQEVVPDRFLFENFTPELYAPRQVFEGLPTEYQSEQTAKNLTVEKVTRWQKHMILTRHPEQADGIGKFLNWRTWVNKLTNHLEINRRKY